MYRICNSPKSESGEMSSTLVSLGYCPEKRKITLTEACLRGWPLKSTLGLLVLMDSTKLIKKEVSVDVLGMSNQNIHVNPAVMATYVALLLLLTL